MGYLKEFVKSHIDLEKYDRRMLKIKKSFKNAKKRARRLFGYRATALWNTLFGKDSKDIQYQKGSRKGPGKYLVIRSEYPRMGLFSTLLWSVPAISWAERFGYTPVIDWELPYIFINDEIGHFDYWTKLFDQGISPSECSKNGRTIISATNFSDYDLFKRYEEMFWVNDLNDHDKTQRIRKLLKRTVLKPREFITPSIGEYFPSIDKGSVIMGVMVREEFCKSNKKIIVNEDQRKLLDDHPTLPDIEDIIATVKEYAGKWGCDHIFLSCACSDTIDIFKGEFKDKLIYVQRDRKTLKEQYVDFGTKAFAESESENLADVFTTEYTLEKESTYFKEIYLLSQCDYLIGSVSGGYVGAMLLRDEDFKGTYLIPYL